MGIIHSDSIADHALSDEFLPAPVCVFKSGKLVVGVASLSVDTMYFIVFTSPVLAFTLTVVV